MLEELANSTSFPHLRHVNLRGTLSTEKDYKQWWTNELHPTKKGFARIAAKIAAVIP
jgi:hypothetical protein